MNEIPSHCDIVIIGGGVAGVSAAYHLSLVTSAKIVILEAGGVGTGRADESLTQDLQFTQASGTSVMKTSTTIKMMTQLYASSSADFIKHHGEIGASRYLRMAAKGLQIQKELASAVLPNPQEQLRSLGSLYIAPDVKSATELEEEFQLLQRLGCTNFEWWPKEKLDVTPGCPPSFQSAIYLPDDAIINSSLYAKSLFKATQSNALGSVELFENCPEVTRVWTKNDHAITELKSGARIVSKHVVVATGGLFTEAQLAGVLRPCYSYLASVPAPASTSTSDASTDTTYPLFSHNFFTWGFTHDWCWTEGRVRCSGEDHFSALKPPRSAERCFNLARWVHEVYPNVFPNSDLLLALPVAPALPTKPHACVDASAPAQTQEVLSYDWLYGVYSETPDSVPLIGHATPASRVCYLLGCNAWGQAALSYSATLVPALLGFAELDDEQRDALALLTVRRFSLLPACKGV